MSAGRAGGIRVRRSWRGLSLPALLAAFAGLAVLYSLATPIFEGPDEIWHFAFASYLASGGGLPVLSIEHPDLLLRNAAHPPLYFLPLAALIAPIDRSDFPASFHFNLASPSITPGSHSDRPNLLVHGRREDFPFRQSVLAVHIGRLWSILLGVITLAGVWVVARLLAPGAGPRLAFATTAIAAFVPQFVYGSAIINNDALAAAGGTWTLAALLALLRWRQKRWAALSGLALGITLLSKIGMVALAPLPLVALILPNLDWLWPGGRKLETGVVHSRVRWGLAAGLLVYAIAAGVAGWWYLRNWLLYGDPLAWRVWQVFAGVGRPTPTLAQFTTDMAGLFGTFWADFGLRVDHQLAGAFAGLVLLALAGWGRRFARREWTPIDAQGWLLALASFLLLLASAVRYSLLVTDIHGRLLYPAIGVVAFGLVVGLAGWGRRLGTGLVAAAVAGLFLVTVSVPVWVIRPAYARPLLAGTTLPAAATFSGQKFGDQLELVGYQLATPRLNPGQPAHLVTYWRRLAPAASAVGDLHADMALILPNGQSIGHIEALPGTSVYPFSEWSPTDIVVTDFVLTPEPGHLPVVADMWLSVRGESLDNLPAPSGGTLVLSRIALGGASACVPAVPMPADFAGLMRLMGYTYSSGQLTLCWLAERAMPVDYTVFIHVMSPAGQVLGANDSQPRAGLYPTSAWLPGESISDEHRVLLPPGSSLRVGLYQLGTGARLSLAGSDQTELVLSP